MFGRKTKRIKELESWIEAEYEDFKKIYEENLNLKKENEILKAKLPRRDLATGRFIKR